MIKRVTAAVFISALMLFLCTEYSFANEPLQLRLFVSKDSLHLELKNISDTRIKVLPYFRYSSGGDPVPIILRVMDAQGRRKYKSYTVDYPLSNIPKNWMYLEPMQATGSTIPIGTLADGFEFRKERYSITATYSWTYYSENGAAHRVRLVSNPVEVISDVDVNEVFCAAHYPDGRSRAAGGLNLPRQAIEMHCGKK